VWQSSGIIMKQGILLLEAMDSLMSSKHWWTASHSQLGQCKLTAQPHLCG